MPFSVFLQAHVNQGFKETDVGRLSNIKQCLSFFFEVKHLKANVLHSIMNYNQMQKHLKEISMPLVAVPLEDSFLVPWKNLKVIIYGLSF